MTKNGFGRGTVFYVGTQLEPKALDKVLNQAAALAGIKPVINAETRLEVVCRTTGDKRYWFIINLTDETLALPQPFAGKTDILTGNTLTAQTAFAPYDVALLCGEGQSL